jgi:hypothetical protein
MEGPDAVTQNIRNSPLHMTTSLASVQHSRLRAAVAPTYPTMMTQTTTQTTTQASTTTTKVTPISKIHNSFSKGLKRTSHPGGGGGGGGGGGSGGGRGGGGGGGGGSGGGEGGGGATGGANQQPVAQAQDVKVAGRLPEAFNGDCTKAEQFIEAMKRYLRMNAMVAGFDSPIRKVAITLTNMDREEVAEWVKNIGAVIDNPDPITDNIPEVWTHFLQLFEQRFVDTQGANKARAILRNLKMKFPYVNQYISDFERLASKANYALDARPTIELFARGLAPVILHDVLSTPKPPKPQKQNKPSITTYKEPSRPAAFR